MNIKGLRVNLANTKLVISDVNQGPTFTSCTQPGGVCCKGVGFSLSFAMVVLTVCIINFVDWAEVIELCSISNAELAWIHLLHMTSTDQFCNHGDMLSTGGDTKASTISHVRSGWKTFRELLPRLKSAALSRGMKRSYIQLALEVMFLMVGESGLWKKVTSAEFFKVSKV